MDLIPSMQKMAAVYAESDEYIGVDQDLDKLAKRDLQDVLMNFDEDCVDLP